MNRLKSTLCWPLTDSMASKVTGGAAVEGVCNAVESGWVKKHFASGEMNPSFLALSIAYRSSVHPM